MAEIVEFATLDGHLQELIRRSLEVRERAHCPYSKFKVGCVIECEDRSTYIGCNVENLSSPLGLCAERTALVSAVAAGNRSPITTIVVSGDLQDDSFLPPCGACRQVMVEFTSTATVVLVRPALDKVMVTSVKHLLPLSSGLLELKSLLGS